jgi:membrane-bound inhibitor of C-type lysozyme
MKNNSADPNVTNHKEMNRDDKRFWTIIVALIVIAAIIFFGINRPANAPSSDDVTASTTLTSVSDETLATSTQTYSYSCDADKSITATFHLPQDDFANVNLSDGRHLILAHTISADGARYANATESFVFWNKGVTAFVTENGTTTYSGCVANRFP